MTTTAEEILYMCDRSLDRFKEQRAFQIQVETYRQAFYYQVYIPMLNRLLADMQTKGLLPKDPL